MKNIYWKIKTYVYIGTQYVVVSSYAALLLTISFIPLTPIMSYPFGNISYVGIITKCRIGDDLFQSFHWKNGDG